MKKATLAIGLFSLVMVATSFVTPATNNSVSQNSDINDIDGGQGRVNKKSDDYAFINAIDGGQGRVNKKSDDYAYGNDIDGGQGRVNKKSDDYAYVSDIDGGQGRVNKKSDDYSSQINSLAFESQVTLSKVKVD